LKAILALVTASLAATAIAVSASAAERYIPGVTDFPSASQSERYVPFVTDFPNRAAEAAPAGAEAHATGGFDGVEAVVGASVVLALGALAAASLPALRRRKAVSSA